MYLLFKYTYFYCNLLIFYDFPNVTIVREVFLNDACCVSYKLWMYIHLSLEKHLHDKPINLLFGTCLYFKKKKNTSVLRDRVFTFHTRMFVGRYKSASQEQQYLPLEEADILLFAEQVW